MLLSVSFTAEGREAPTGNRAPGFPAIVQQNQVSTRSAYLWSLSVNLHFPRDRVSWRSPKKSQLSSDTQRPRTECERGVCLEGGGISVGALFLSCRWLAASGLSGPRVLTCKVLGMTRRLGSQAPAQIISEAPSHCGPRSLALLRWLIPEKEEHPQPLAERRQTRPPRRGQHSHSVSGSNSGVSPVIGGRASRKSQHWPGPTTWAGSGHSSHH